MKDWVGWHEAYDDPGSSLSRRLHVVRACLSECLDSVRSPVPRLLALCAGDARDVLPVLASRRDGEQVAAALIEKDDELAERACVAAADARLSRVQVRCADAGDPSSFRDVVPVDVLMLCGIFGNVDHTSVRRIVQRVPAMVVAGGYVLWTRGGEEAQDRRPEVRRWFIEAGMPEVSFDGPPETYGVGVNQIRGGGEGRLDDSRLFVFA